MSNKSTGFLIVCFLVLTLFGWYLTDGFSTDAITGADTTTTTVVSTTVADTTDDSTTTTVLVEE